MYGHACSDRLMPHPWAPRSGVPAMGMAHTMEDHWMDTTMQSRQDGCIALLTGD